MKYLIYNNHYGWGNKIVHIICHCIYCYLTDRTFIVDDTYDSDKGVIPGYRFWSPYFTFKHIKWKTIDYLENIVVDEVGKNGEILKLAQKYIKGMISDNIYNKIRRMHRMDRVNYIDEAGSIIQYKEDVIYVARPKDLQEIVKLLSLFNNEPNLNKICRNFRNYFCDAFKFFVDINPSILSESRNFVSSYDFQNIAVSHLRYYNNHYHFSEEAENFKEAIKKTILYIQSHRPEKMYISCDNETVFEKIKSKFHTEIIRLDRVLHYDMDVEIEEEDETGDLIKTKEREALVEAMIMAHGCFLIPTRTSTYSTILIPCFMRFLNNNSLIDLGLMGPDYLQLRLLDKELERNKKWNLLNI